MTQSQKSQLVFGLGAAGNVAGILVAIKRKSGFWRGVGWFLLLGAAGSALGYVASSMVPDKESTLSVTDEDGDKTEIKVSL
jgi:uncharacterized membrane protein YfcA